MRGAGALDKICIKNVRSLKDTGLVSLSPITLLLGENSSGKSTFLRAFPLLKQSISKRTDGPLLWAGDVDDYVDFGSFLETVTNDRKTDSIEFQFSYRLSGEDSYDQYMYRLPHSLRRAFGDVWRETEEISYAISIRQKDNREYVSNLKVCINETAFEFELSPVRRLGAAKVNGEPILKISSREKDRQGVLGVRFSRYVSEVFEFSLPPIGGLISDILKPLLPKPTRGEQQSYMLYSYQSQLVDMMRLIGECLCKNMEPEEIRERFRGALQGEMQDKLNILMRMLEVEDEAQAFSLGLFKLIYFYARFWEIENYLNTYFRQVHYIAPLRATAERYYRLRNLAIAEVDYQGKNLAIFLSGLTPARRLNFQQWTQKHFGFKVEVEKSVGHLSVKIALKNSRKSFNLSDTGFGYSQILPIITQLWDLSTREVPNRRENVPLVIAIEQPELHLHPALQARLTGAFIAAQRLAEQNGYQLQLILETHSETIVNYLGRAIATGAIKSGDVSVVLFEKDPDTNLTNVRISDYDGDGFLENWPIGFFAPKE